jgi:hypothetical protein
MRRDRKRMPLRGQSSCPILNCVIPHTDERKYTVFVKGPADVRYGSSFVFGPFVDTEYEGITEIVFCNLVSYVALVSFLEIYFLLSAESLCYLYFNRISDSSPRLGTYFVKGSNEAILKPEDPTKEKIRTSRTVKELHIIRNIIFQHLVALRYHL